MHLDPVLRRLLLHEVAVGLLHVLDLLRLEVGGREQAGAHGPEPGVRLGQEDARHRHRSARLELARELAP